MGRTQWKNTIKRMLPLGLMLLFLIGGLCVLPGFSVDDLIRYTPKNHLIVMLVIWLFYAAKSLAMVFPVIALYIASGMIFSPPVAIMVNLVGMVIGNTIPFFIGRYSCTDFVERMLHKYPNIKKVYNWTSRNDIVSAYILRVIGCLPGDVVSLFFGASGVKYLPYLLGSILGKLPVLILATLMGNQIHEPLSAKFLIPLAVLVALSFTSTWLMSKKLNRNVIKHPEQEFVPEAMQQSFHK